MTVYLLCKSVFFLLLLLSLLFIDWTCGVLKKLLYFFFLLLFFCIYLKPLSPSHGWFFFSRSDMRVIRCRNSFNYSFSTQRATKANEFLRWGGRVCNSLKFVITLLYKNSYSKLLKNTPVTDLNTIKSLIHENNICSIVCVWRAGGNGGEKVSNK